MLDWSMTATSSEVSRYAAHRIRHLLRTFSVFPALVKFLHGLEALWRGEDRLVKGCASFRQALEFARGEVQLGQIHVCQKPGKV